MLELTEIVTELNLADTMSLDEFLNNPEEDTVYGVPNDEFIQDLVELYRMPSDVHVDDSEVDDSIELPIVNCSFLQQQEDSKDLLKHINYNTLDRYISLKSMNVMKQTTIDEFSLINIC